MISKFQKAVYSIQKNLAGSLIAMTVGAILLSLAPTAQAEGYAIGVDVPLQFSFTGDLRGTARPSGFKVTLDMPFHVGVGTESYSVDVDDSNGAIVTTIDYDFVDVYVWWHGDTFTVSAGFGTGGAQIEDFTDAVGTFSAEEADADQSFIVLGWILSPSWEFHVGYHQIDAEADLEQNGVLTGTKLDLGGIMHSAGFKLLF